MILCRPIFLTFRTDKMAYRASSYRGLGIVQIIIGALMVILAIVSIAVVRDWSSYVGFGFWIGVWVIVTGVLGYSGARSEATPNRCLIGTFMGFAITSCVLSGIMLICYSAALAQFSDTIRGYHGFYDDHDHYRGYSRTSYREYRAARAGVGVGSCLLILAISEFCIAMGSAICCCATLCCGATVQTTGHVQQVQYVVQQPGVMAQPGGAGVIIINPTGHAAVSPQVQTVMMPGQPMQPVYWAPPPVGAVPATGTPAPTGATAAAATGTAPYQQPQYNQATIEEKPPAYAE